MNDKVGICSPGVSLNKLIWKGVTKMKNLSVKLCVPVLIGILFLAGCRAGEAREELAAGPDIRSIQVANTFAPRAIKVTGGYEAWLATKELEFDCVVTFYEPEGSFYLTEQHHEIYPWSNSIRISSTEPASKLDPGGVKRPSSGEVIWELTGEDFSVSKGPRVSDSLPAGLSERAFAEAVLYITTAPVRFLDKSVSFIEGTKPVKKEGQWYFPIERVGSGVTPYWSKVIFYQNKNNSLVDMIWFSNAEGVFLSARGYDYYDTGGEAVVVPTKVEISRTDARGVIQERLVQIDFK